MEKNSLSRLAGWMHGECTGELEIPAVSTDSRTAGGALFLPLVGERFDAHDFIPQAVGNGALAVVSHRRGELEQVCTRLITLSGGRITEEVRP